MYLKTLSALTSKFISIYVYNKIMYFRKMSFISRLKRIFLVLYILIKHFILNGFNFQETV